MIDLRDEIHRLTGLISYQGITTADGAIGGGTLVCTGLTVRPEYNGNLVVITSGAFIGQGRDINGTTLAGTVTPAVPFGGMILAGTEFIIAALRMTPAEVAAIEEKLDLQTVLGTMVYLDAGGEQIVFTTAAGRPWIIHTIWLDLSNLTQNNDIRIYHQIDGVNWQIVETFNWTVGMDPGVYFRNVSITAGRDLRVTVQETADEGADRNIPYWYAYEMR